VDHQEVGWRGIDWIDMAQDSDSITYVHLIT
jgi:hypothetical protein